MKKSFSRLDRVNSLLYREISGLIAKDFGRDGDQGRDVLINLSKVETSKDLGESRIFFTVLPEAEERKIQVALNRKASEWQRVIGERLVLKRKPKLRFILDAGIKNAIKVEEILSQIRAE
ncbi:MAG: 30S ribosome-binding factor RbfA [Candidatus Moranbacteria bacterium]|nr:30S ribosome-binding factor RbfA [Candidatus Moranbacteria bacterium]